MANTYTAHVPLPAAVTGFQHLYKAKSLILLGVALFYCLLKCRLEDMEKPVTAENLITTLKNMNVANIHDMEYMALYSGSKTLDSLVQLTGLPLDFAHYKPKDLNRIIKKILK